VAYQGLLVVLVVMKMTMQGVEMVGVMTCL
jgi:hypothetical protein